MSLVSHVAEKSFLYHVIFIAMLKAIFVVLSRASLFLHDAFRFPRLAQMYCACGDLVPMIDAGIESAARPMNPGFSFVPRRCEILSALVRPPLGRAHLAR
jgi:hypothetical protein